MIGEEGGWWLGGTDLGREGRWLYISSLTPVPPQLWSQEGGQPNEGVEANCLYMRRGHGGLYDFICDSHQFPVCQLPTAATA